MKSPFWWYFIDGTIHSSAFMCPMAICFVSFLLKIWKKNRSTQMWDDECVFPKNENQSALPSQTKLNKLHFRMKPITTSPVRSIPLKEFARHLKPFERGVNGINFTYEISYYLTHWLQFFCLIYSVAHCSRIVFSRFCLFFFSLGWSGLAIFPTNKATIVSPKQKS